MNSTDVLSPSTPCVIKEEEEEAATLGGDGKEGVWEAHTSDSSIKGDGYLALITNSSAHLTTLNPRQRRCEERPDGGGSCTMQAITTQSFQDTGSSRDGRPCPAKRKNTRQPLQDRKARRVGNEAFTSTRLADTVASRAEEEGTYVSPQVMTKQRHNRRWISNGVELSRPRDKAALCVHKKASAFSWLTVFEIKRR